MRRRVPLTAALALVLSLPWIACTSNSTAGEATESTGDRSENARLAVEAEKPIRIAQGQPVDLAEWAVEGKITVFDFMSDYCPPCVQIAPWLDRLHAEREDVVVVKIDVNRPDVRGIDWQSPVLRQYGINSIPHFKIYGADGARAKVIEWLQQLPQTSAGR